ncbi:MAG: hypothetical protein ACLRXC_12815 [[Clostridium] leptum]
MEKQDKVKERQADLDKAVTEGREKRKSPSCSASWASQKDLAQAVAKRDALAQ